MRTILEYRAVLVALLPQATAVQWRLPPAVEPSVRTKLVEQLALLPVLILMNGLE
jgi:hypothetical protein